jgi:hypothetical protein
MNPAFLTDAWRDPVLHIHLLQQLETYPPFGVVRDTNIENITAQLNRALAASGKGKMTREQVEARIDRIVATKHAAFANVDTSAFLHPDFVRMRSDAVAKHAGEYDAKAFASPLPVNPKNKRARTSATSAAAASSGAAAVAAVADEIDATTTTTATAAPADNSSADSPADAALNRDANLVARMRRFERTWIRYQQTGEKFKEFAKFVYGAFASTPSRSATLGEVLAYVQQNLKKALVQGEAVRFAAKSDDELRDVIQKTLLNNAVFFALPYAAGGDPMKQPWTVGSVAALKMENDTDNN